MKKLMLLMALGVFTAAGCGGGDDTDDPTDPTDSRQPCEVASNCEPGEFCDDGYCAPWEGCTPESGQPNSCEEGQLCDDDFVCKSVEQKCETSAQGCECHIVNSAGQLAATGTPRIVLGAGASMQVQAVLAVKQGAPLPGASFTADVSGDGFTADGTSVIAGDAAGESTLTVEFGAYAQCSATLVNLGAVTEGNVRVYVFDDLTNQPVADAVVIVDTNADGTDDGAAAATGTDGTTETTAGVAGTYSVTVFAEGYNYLSMVGLDASSANDISVPLSSRAIEPEKGGFTGQLNFTEYEERYLGGDAAAVKAGVVAGSLPLKALLNFNTDLLIGEISDADCSAEPTPAGCYEVSIAGLVDETIALPGGVVAGLAATPIKPHFDSVAVPGRRYAWSLGTEVEIADLSGVINVVTPYLQDCSCDATPDVCDEAAGGGGECSCDLDCGLNLDIGSLYDDIVPLISSVATGLKGNLSLPAGSAQDWNDHITGEYGSADRESDPRYPVLDDGTGEYGQLALREAWSRFTAFAAPDLPNDPLKPGSKMEAMLAVTGIQAKGMGLVPLGLGLGLDCTEGDCLSADGVFDGQLNGGQICYYSLDDTENRCPKDVLAIAPEGQLPDGHLPVFSAPPFAGLESGSPQRTIIIAAPITELLNDLSQIRISAILVNHAEGTGIDTGVSQQIASRSFPEESGAMEAITGRSYTPTKDADMHWATFSVGGEGEGEVSTRWNVYFAGASSFEAPTAPSWGADPFTPSAAGVINVTHMLLELSGSDLGAVASNNGTTLNGVFDLVEGAAVLSRDVPAQ